jgi:hypothetical protein
MFDGRFPIDTTRKPSMDVMVQLIGRWFVRTTPRAGPCGTCRDQEDLRRRAHRRQNHPRDDTSTRGATRATACARSGLRLTELLDTAEAGGLRVEPTSEVMLAVTIAMAPTLAPKQSPPVRHFRPDPVGHFGPHQAVGAGPATAARGCGAAGSLSATGRGGLATGSSGSSRASWCAGWPARRSRCFLRLR